MNSKGRWILILNAGDKIDLTFIENTIDKGDIVGVKMNPAKTSGSMVNNSFIKNGKFLSRGLGKNQRIRRDNDRRLC